MGAPRGYRTETIVVRVIEYGETSQIVHLATPDHGTVTAIAKGARNPKAAFQGGLSLATIGEADLVPRPRAEMELLRAFRMTDGLPGLRADLDRFAAGEYVVGLLRDLMRPALAAPALFRAGVAGLKAVAQAPVEHVPLWVVVFEARALAACGHRPHLASCVACGEAVPSAARFDASQGGLVHARCARGSATLSLSAAGLAFLRRLYTARLAEFVSEPASPSEVGAARAVHDLFLPYVLERLPAARHALPR